MKPLYYCNGAAWTPLLGGRTVRRNSGGKRPQKRPGCTGNVIAFGSEGDVNDNRAPNTAVNPNGTTLPLVVVQSPDEDSTNTLSPEARDEHAVRFSLLISARAFVENTHSCVVVVFVARQIV